MATTSTTGRLLALFFVIFLAHAASGVSLDCYKCTSIQDSKCGASWGYKSASLVPDEFKVKCHGKNAICKKVVSRDGPAGTEFVIRDCFNSTESDLPDDFHSCHDMMKAGNICYCGEENCNGQGHLIASGILATVAIFTAYLVMS